MSELRLERRDFLATSAGAVAAAAAGSIPLWSTAASRNNIHLSTFWSTQMAHFTES